MQGSIVSSAQAATTPPPRIGGPVVRECLKGIGLCSRGTLRGRMDPKCARTLCPQNTCLKDILFTYCMLSITYRWTNLNKEGVAEPSSHDAAHHIAAIQRKTPIYSGLCASGACGRTVGDAPTHHVAVYKPINCGIRDFCGAPWRCGPADIGGAIRGRRRRREDRVG